ncbi:hypothetical protein GUJ93_ZPchr0006g44648 [Zizania palustris]|uniref:Uncharacterized protein n=1 Tax=Zizania palustris TaxID=103762 RepID=A0A8J5T1V2_ZIZPA|nr:hypothetical protein GUJ93_ZPchr0006g44648 [Zizania palustris]
MARRLCCSRAALARRYVRRGSTALARHVCYSCAALTRRIVGLVLSSIDISHFYPSAVGSTAPPPLRLALLREISPSSMGFFRRIAGIFGGSRDDADHHEPVAGSSAAGEVPQNKVAAAAAAAAAAGNVQRRGFSVQVPVPVERPGPGPVLVPCPQGEGGVQGKSNSYLQLDYIVLP